MRTFRADGTEVMPGDEITSRTGEAWIFQSATHTTTPTTFGKIVVTRPRPAHWRDDPLPALAPRESGLTFADFAFGLTVRG